MVAFIFHEVRVPLNTLTLGLSNLEKDAVFNQLSTNQREVLDAINTSVATMENVLNEVKAIPFRYWELYFLLIKI